MPTAITELVFQNAGVAPLEGGYTTVGQAFRPGALMPGQTLLAQIGGTSVPVQVDVRTTHPDGSVKMAALTLARPTLEPWQEVTAELVAGGTAPAATPVSLPGVLAGHDAALKLAIEDGRPPLSIDIDAAISQAVALGTASFWQKGPLATQARVEIPVADSSMRVVLDVTAYKDGEIRFTVGLNNDRAMEDTGGRLSYVATVTLDGETLFKQGISQGQYQRISLDFASSDKHGIQGLGAPHEGWLNVKHDLDYLSSTNAVFPFSPDFVADPGTLRYYHDQVADNPQWGEILWPHHVLPAMGTTGGRPDIGFTTGPNADWLLSQDAAAAAFALGQAKAAGYVPWNFYDQANGTVLNTDNYPRLWVDPRGGTGTPGNAGSTGLTQQVPRDMAWEPDTAHQPDLSFVPYLLTGERWIYDNLMAQGSHSIMAVWPSPRGSEAGLVIPDNQLRGTAWSMRQIDHAAWAAVDGSAEQDYFSRKLAGNWEWLLSKIPEWTGTWGEIAGFVPSAGTERLQVWQMNLLATVTALSAARGNEEARQALDFMSDFMLGLIEATDAGLGPRYAGLVSIPLKLDGQPIDTWAELAEGLAREGRLIDTGFAAGELEYQRIAISALSMAYRVTGEERFKDAVETYLALKPPGTTNWSYENGLRMGLVIPESFAATVNDPLFPTGRSFDPVSIERGAGPDEIRLSLSQDYYDGAVQYRVLVDGVDATGPLTASALKSRAEADTVTIHGDFGATVTVSVQMLNDRWGGVTGKDRNLYLNAISYNDQDLPTRAYIASDTPVRIVFSADGTLLSPAPEAAAPPPIVEIPSIAPLPPRTVEVGEGPDTVVIRLSQDWYLDSARYQVRIDGKDVGPELEAAAFHSAGQSDTLLVHGNFSDRPASISIRFANNLLDGYGRDRNLHIESASFRGQDLEIGPNQTLFATADIATIAFDLPDVTPKTVVVGEGPDAITFAISQNYWLGKALYRVLVNGQEYGEHQLVSALAANGEHDTLIVRGDFPEGTRVGLQLLNDNPLPGNGGRDIFIHGASIDGQPLAIDRTSLTANIHVGTIQVGVSGNSGAPLPAPPLPGGSTAGPSPNHPTEPQPEPEPPPPGGSTGGPSPNHPTEPESPPPAAPDLPARVFLSNEAAPAPNTLFAAEAGRSWTYTAAETGLARSEATVTYRPGEVDAVVTTAWNSLKTVMVTDLDGGLITVRNAVETWITLGGEADSTVTVVGAKRGVIQTAAGDDSVTVTAFSNTGETGVAGAWNDTATLGNVIAIATGSGNDSIAVTGWNGWTTAEVSAGAGNDLIVGSDGSDRLRGGTGDDVITGGAGRDRFHFQAGDGKDVITDFNADPASGDILMMETLSRADVSWAQTAAGTLVSYGNGDTILLEGVMDGLSWSAFRFVQAEIFA